MVRIYFVKFRMKQALTFVLNSIICSLNELKILIYRFIYVLIIDFEM